MSTARDKLAALVAAFDDPDRAYLSQPHPGRVPRFSDLPRLVVVLLDRPDIASAGAGETPLVTVAPAIANAICSATGRRLRSLPLAAAAPQLGTASSG